METSSQVNAGRPQSRGFILGSLSFGHGISHLYDQGLPVLMPTIASAMRLSNFQVSVLQGIRLGGFGVVNLGGGLFVDMLKRQWGPILTGCVFWAAAAFALIGASPNYAFLVGAVVLISIRGALWHLPATAALSQRFPDRRGFAISIHGFGSNVGNGVGPILAPVLLRLFTTWRYVFFAYAAPTLLMGLFVWWALKDVGKGGQDRQRTLGDQADEAWKMVHNPMVMALVLAAMLRGVGLDAVFHWAPFYLEEDLGKGHIEAGLYYALLTGMGIVSTPVLGILSDRIGRKGVLVPGLIVAAAFSFVVVAVGDSILLVPVFIGMGLFSFALHQIIQVAVLDLVARGTEATATGLAFGLNGVISGVTPFLAFLIIEYLGGYGSIFYYAGILTLVPAFLIIVLPLPMPKVSSIAAA